MIKIYLQTTIAAPIQIVFDLSRSIDLHLESTAGTNEKAIAGKTSGLISLNETVTWRAKHFGIYQNFTSKITQFDPPNSFTDEMVKGAFASFKHEHLFQKNGDTSLMTDEIYFQAPLGLLGKIIANLILKSYLKKFLEERNAHIKYVAEKSAG